MSWRDQEDVASWGLMLTIGVAIVMFLVWVAVGLVNHIGSESDKRECARRGGKVDHYDEHHGSYWRCLPPTTEAP